MKMNDKYYLTFGNQHDLRVPKTVARVLSYSCKSAKYVMVAANLEGIKGHCIVENGIAKDQLGYSRWNI